MRWIAAVLLMLALASPAWAFNTYRFGARVVAVGDSTGKLVQATKVNLSRSEEDAISWDERVWVTWGDTAGVVLTQ